MRIIFIPHSTERTFIFNRSHELALELSKRGHKVFFLEWKTSKTGDDILFTVYTQVLNLLTFYKKEEHGLCYLHLPIVKIPKKSAMIRFINSWIVNFFIRFNNVDVVIDSNVFFYDLKYIKGATKIYDLVDDHLTVNREVGIDQTAVDIQISNIRHADQVITITSLLRKKVTTCDPEKKVHLIENGFYPDRFSKISESSQLRLQDRLGLKSSTKVIGYIGNIDRWVNLEVALEAFGIAYACQQEDAVFLVVGKSSNHEYYEQLKKNYQQHNIIFVGGVPKEAVYHYFSILKIGIIPFSLSEFTRNAFPIKTLEYAAGQATVLSSRLDLLEEKKFGFVRFFDDVKSLAHLMKTESGLSEPAEEVSAYSWPAAARQFEQVMDAF